MRSRDSARELVESLLRVAGIALLAWMLWRSLDRERPYQVTSARSADLPRALRVWTGDGVAPDAIHVLLDGTPTPGERDWLAALQAAGSRVSWSGSLPPVGIDVQPVAAPRGGLNVLVAAPKGTSLELSDDVGVLDSAMAGEGGARFAIPAGNGTIVVRAAGSRALTRVPPPARTRGVLVIGAAGWESKFVVAALEEDDWTVDVDLRVAPGADVTQGASAEIDTSRYSAVIALDATVAPRAEQIVRYVTSGGGLILGGSAASVATLAPLRVGGMGRIEAAPATGAPAPTTLHSLAVAPLTRPSSDAVVLDRRDGAIIVAARRHGAGRVLQLGYEDTWRWRMSGSATSAADHRAWWTRAVASVAHATRGDSVTEHAARIDPDPAPIAALIDALGTGSVGATVVGTRTTTRVPASWLFALLSLCLLGEWLSRRMRGAR